MGFRSLIFYISMDLGLSNKKYIIGHDNLRNPDDAYNDENQMPFIQDTWCKIIDWMNRLVKDSASIISKNQDFFNSLSDIEQVIVYGHSFYEVDWPYMEEVVKQIGSDKPWAISYHKPERLDANRFFYTKGRIEESQEICLVGLTYIYL